jgi:hypothetical protein
MARIGSYLTYANVMATVAVFIALGGSSYAAVTLSKNSVNTGQIKNGQVKTADLGKNAVTGNKVADHSLLAKDFKLGQLPAGAQGPAGASGPQGPKGETAAVDTSNFYSRAESDDRFLGTSAKAADSDLLDGKDSTDFVSGSGRAFSGHATVGSGLQGSPFGNGDELNGLALRLDCDNVSSGDNATQVWIRNYSSSPTPAWMDNGGADATYATLGASGGTPLTAGVKTGDVPDQVTFRVLFGERDLTLDVWSKRNAGSCLFAWDVRID